MGRKRKLKKVSRSEKWMQKLYDDAIKEVKERNFNIDDSPPVINNENPTDDASIEEKQVPQKPRKKPKEVLEESVRKQEELRKSRVSLCVPVSRLVPFKPDEKGLAFPRDFRRDSTSQSWIPRSGKSLPGDVHNGCRSPSSDFDKIEHDIICCSEEASEVNAFEEILKVFPLRVHEDDDISTPEISFRSRQLPPIYRQEVWRKTMRRASEPSRSIPAKKDAWNIRDPTSLMIGRQELYSREKCKSSISLAERRFRLRIASTGAVLP
ncbi:uncharacterized protein [Montipora capricornis]|uniref:uncharacterized protein n=1 Tax=Montipora capricornis TaxID=246305 RepID=UPI0035F1F224